jgi:hypothetical protein
MLDGPSSEASRPRGAQAGLRRATVTASRVGRFKPIGDFDWNWRKHIDRDAIESALRLGFLARSRNVVLVASPTGGPDSSCAPVAACSRRCTGTYYCKA